MADTIVTRKLTYYKQTILSIDFENKYNPFLKPKEESAFSMWLKTTTVMRKEKQQHIKTVAISKIFLCFALLYQPMQGPAKAK